MQIRLELNSGSYAIQKRKFKINMHSLGLVSTKLNHSSKNMRFKVQKSFQNVKNNRGQK